MGWHLQHPVANQTRMQGRTGRLLILTRSARLCLNEHPARGLLGRFQTGHRQCIATSTRPTARQHPISSTRVALGRTLSRWTKVLEDARSHGVCVQLRDLAARSRPSERALCHHPSEQRQHSLQLIN